MYDNVCRSCLSGNKDLKPIVDCAEGTDSLYSMFTEITTIQISTHDGMPQTICLICLNDLKNAFKFKRKCLASDKTLHNYFNNVKPIGAGETVQSDLQSKQMVKLESCDGETHTGVSFDNGNDTDSKEVDFTEENDNGTIKGESEAICAEVKNELVSDNISQVEGTRAKKQQQHKCEICFKVFAKQTYLKVHKRCHIPNDRKEYRCDICGRQYVYAYQLTQHAFKHSEEKPFPCSSCGRGCLTAESLRRHMRIHESTYCRPKHTCTICEKDFAYPSFLAEHMKNHTGERPYLCSFCGKGFRQSGALDYHIRIHTGLKPHTCSVCHEAFMSQAVLKVHMRRHTNERPYVCDVCGRAFRQSTDMRSHRRTHTGDRPIQCNVCEKRMSTTGQLTVHMRTHTGEKPFPCATCGKAFSTRTMLIKHERVHTGERPYACVVCSRAFSQTSSLNTHMKTHSKNKPTPTVLAPMDKIPAARCRIATNEPNKV